jgi:hypothetical protein
VTVLRIPTPKGVPSFQMRVNLEQVQYQVELSWNERAERWFMLLRTSAGDLITSRKVIPNWPLLRGLVHADRPPGELFAIDAAKLGTPIGLNDWGERVVLDYFEASDVAELVAAAGG